jgi:Amt family ammonium transporter
MNNLMKRVGQGSLATAAAWVATTGWALAQEAADAAAEAAPEAEAAVATLNSGDTAWMLTSTALVLLMTIPGLALFYGGMVRKKNVLSMLAQCFAITCVMSVLWMIAGYSLTFTDGGAMQMFVGGLSKAFLSGVTKDALSGTIPESLFATFQMTFAIITPALIVGAFADRMKFSALLWFSGLWLLLVYSPVAHWVWGGGFLADKGALDFAGGLVVHLNAGVAGLVACLVLGRRVGYGTENFSPHNLVYSVIGASLLWVGWFGFNAGSAVSAGEGAAMAMLVTQIATAAAALAWMFSEWLLSRKPSVLGMISGAVSGLVAITPAAGFVDPMGALWIGIIAGVICYVASVWIKRMFGYDDALDVWGVHGVGGAAGAILTGIFASEAIGGTAGVLEGNIGQLWIQTEGVLYTLVYCGVVTFIILKVVDVVIGLRVKRDVEVEGLDINLHGETVHS